MPQLDAQNLTLAYTETPVVQGLCLAVPEGRITALVGPNGCGKSTILRAMARILQPKAGAVYLDGKAIHKQPTKKVAQQLAILPQSPEAPAGLTVRELVCYGRFPYQSGFGVLSREDRLMVCWALEVTGMTTFAERTVGSLSGGQRQRAWIAMALAQGTKVLLLDEPTTFLDIAHQLEVLHLLETLNRDEGRTIVMVLHDLNQAARYSHHMVAIAEGEIVVSGTPREVVIPEVLTKVFGVEADVVTDPRTGVPFCIPYGIFANGNAGKASRHD